MIKEEIAQPNALTVESVTQNNLAKHAIHVHKFGGSSLATPECIKRAIEIIRQNCQLNDIVVVSANGKTTDALFSLYQLAEQENLEKNDLIEAITELTNQQQLLINELLNTNNSRQLVQRLTQDIEQLTTWLTNNLASHHNDILAFGEVWSARLLSALLNEQVCPSISLDAREFLVIDNEQSGLENNTLSSTQ
jgi:aspartokinase/homoserine dehydrogenase 2